MRHRSASLLAIVWLAACSKAQAAEYLDLAPFGRMTTAVNGGLRTTTIDAAREAIELPLDQGALQIQFRY